jgi:hypothetical protein
VRWRFGGAETQVDGGSELCRLKTCAYRLIKGATGRMGRLRGSRARCIGFQNDSRSTHRLTDETTIQLSSMALMIGDRSFKWDETQDETPGSQFDAY